MASARSVGKTLRFRDREHAVKELKPDSFSGIDLALFSAGGGISEEFAPAAAAAGAVVIDNSSAFRMDPEVPLVVPEVILEGLGLPPMMVMVEEVQEDQLFCKVHELD